MSQKLLKQKGVYGVGVGLKNPRKPQEGAALIIYTSVPSTVRTAVGTGYSAKKVGKKQEIPIRMVRTKRFCCRLSPSHLRRRIRPLVAGFSIGTQRGSGTAGLMVTDRSGCPLVLSNNHVLNLNNSNAYAPTFQPGGSDSQSVWNRIGRLDRYVPLKKAGFNYIDAATSVPFRRGLLAPRYAGVGVVPGHVTSYRVGERLKKVGRTTGFATGRVESVHTDVQVDYGSYGGLGSIQYDNMTVIRGSRPVSLPGDSGSVWLRRSDNYAAAVNFAGTADGLTSISFPIEWFMQVFRARVARPDGTGVRKVIRRRGSQYTRLLTPNQIRQLQVRRARSR